MLWRKKSGEWASRQKNDKTKRVAGFGRRTREEIVKWNHMTALRFQTGERHQTSPASLRGSGVGARQQQNRPTWLKEMNQNTQEIF